MRPLLSAVCKNLALQLADPKIMEHMRQHPAGIRLWAHFVLYEAQRVVLAFCRAASSTNVKSAAKEAMIPTSLFQVALLMTSSFRCAVMFLFSQDLSIKSFPVKYLGDFPALPLPDAATPYPVQALP